MYSLREPIVNKLHEMMENPTLWDAASDLLKVVDENTIEDKVTRKVMELEPIMRGCQIGKENYYCEHCKTRVKRKDRFCRGCGYEFREEV